MADQVDTQHLYVNCNINNPATATSSIPCTFLKQFGTALLDDTGNWKASIVRFSLPISALPYFNCTPNTYIFTLSYNSVDYSVPVSVINWDSANSSDTNVYYVQQFIDSCNLALSVAEAKVALANPSIPALATAPQLQWNPSTNLISLLTPFNTWESGAPNTPAIWMNTPLAELFASMPQTLFATNSGSAKDVQFRIISRPQWTATTTGTNMIALNSGAVSIAHLTAGLTSGSTVAQLAVSATSQPLGVGQQFFIGSSPQYASSPDQTFTISLPGAAVGATNIPVTAQTAAAAYATPGTQIYMQNYSQLTFAVPTFLPAGTTLALTSGSNRQIVVTSAPAAAGDTLVMTQPFITNFAYAVGSTVTPVSANGTITTAEESASVLNWWTTESIIVTTTMIPARTEVVQSLVQSQYGMARVLTDFYIPPQDRISANNSLLYLPTAQYRWFDMMQQEKLRDIDLQFYAGDASGLQTNWQPIQIAPGQNASVKLLFQHRCVTDHKARDRPTKKQKLDSGGALFVR